KCFERAAEKHHADSLSSIVASCSWGKHVAVGTGSRFDIVWDPKEINTNEIEGMNVYNFLHMVKGLANGEEENNACLGEDIDDLLDDENVDLDMSPQHTSGFDAVFDETFELLSGPTSNGWDSNKDQIDQTTNSNDWSGWGQKKSEIQEDSSKSNAWGAATNQNSGQQSSWGKSIKGGEDDAVQNTQWESGIQKDSSKSSAWGAATNQNNNQSWGKTKPVAQDAV
ncbi:DNA-directed RNA polymerase E subunit 1-like, partial [Trifolium medium]|nr:DNA-directed RNA polymerase E subunit 1-like [Trifolium medium]